MTLFASLRNKTMPGRRRRPNLFVDMNADIMVARPTGDPRLDLARAISQAAGR